MRSQRLGLRISSNDSTFLLIFIFIKPLETITANNHQVAMDKAFTAAGHRVGTHIYKEAVWPGGAAYGLGNSNGGRFTTFGGGLPIMNAKGEIIGGIGASTGTPAQDQQVAQAGVDALNVVLKKVKAKL